MQTRTEMITDANRLLGELGGPQCTFAATDNAALGRVLAGLRHQCAVLRWRQVSPPDGTVYRAECGAWDFRVWRASGRWYAEGHAGGGEGWFLIGPGFGHFIRAVEACARRAGLVRSMGRNARHEIEGRWPVELETPARAH